MRRRWFGIVILIPSRLRLTPAVLIMGLAMIYGPCPMWIDLSGNSESGYLNNFMCNGTAATAYFNPPPYQMAASLIAPPAAWTTRVAGANYQGLTLALPIDGIGGIISPAEQRPPPYAPLTTPRDYLTISTRLPISVSLGAPKQAVSYSDLVFYMDTSYNKNLGFRTVTAFMNDYSVIPISSALLQALLVFLLSVCRRRKRFILATTLTFKGRAPLCRLLAVITPSPSPMFMLRVPNYSAICSAIRLYILFMMR